MPACRFRLSTPMNVPRPPSFVSRQNHQSHMRFLCSFRFRRRRHVPSWSSPRRAANHHRRRVAARSSGSVGVATVFRGREGTGYGAPWERSRRSAIARNITIVEMRYVGEKREAKGCCMATLHAPGAGKGQMQGRE